MEFLKTFRIYTDAFVEYLLYLKSSSATRRLVDARRNLWVEAKDSITEGKFNEILEGVESRMEKEVARIKIDRGIEQT